MPAGLKYVEDLGAVSATIVAPIPLPVAVASWLGSAAPTVGQKAMAASLPVVVASDQTAIPVTSTQLPAALAGGKLDVNVGTWLGSAAPTVGQKAMASSVPVAIASDQTALEVKEQSATGTSTSVASNVANVTLLAANANRRGATFVQDGAGGVLMLKLGATASAASFTVILSNRDYYEVPAGYTGIVDGIWFPAVGSVRVTELT